MEDGAMEDGAAEEADEDPDEIGGADVEGADAGDADDADGDADADADVGAAEGDADAGAAEDEGNDSPEGVGLCARAPALMMMSRAARSAGREMSVIVVRALMMEPGGIAVAPFGSWYVPDVTIVRTAETMLRSLPAPRSAAYRARARAVRISGRRCG